jgi:hypothetical protein
MPRLQGGKQFSTLYREFCNVIRSTESFGKVKCLETGQLYICIYTNSGAAAGCRFD